MVAIVPFYGTVVGTTIQNIANGMIVSLCCSFDAERTVDDYFCYSGS